MGLDFAFGGAQAAEHLLRLGHRRIGVIVHGSAPDRINHISRLKGFTAALVSAGVALAAADIYYGDSSIESGYAAAATLLTRATYPTAVFATNDLMAIGALNAAWDHGVRVPDQLTVVGFDNIVMSAHVRPALTTIGVPVHDLATEAMELLLRCVERHEQRSYHLSLRPSLFVRRSSDVPAAPGDQP